MINKSEVNKIINVRKTLQPDDPRITSLWDKLSDILGEDIKSTISYLEEASTEEINWIAEVFEDISQQLQSQELIDCLEKLQKKFPEIDMDVDIKFAKQALE